MAYRLHQDLWFCRIGQQLIFLDVHADRYFRLPTREESLLVQRLRGNTGVAPLAIADGNQVDRLLSLGFPGEKFTSTPPTRSTMEERHQDAPISLHALPAVAYAIASTQARLRLQPLKNVVSHMQRYRSRRAAKPQRAETTPPPSALEAVDVFNGLRLYVPIAPCCLLDSIAMSMFLARHGIHCQVVFGVTSNPFGAHSWVQAGHVVLNDSVGSVSAYTPIGVF
ncbi:lasso peptide biosynthesis B2 protein [Luteimonas sp. YGD11-2]|uniref:lasso peptide biosynthesis B2 protein n=1 Tax=Luteimonas sp. YGD11-2 TaxID=2508168 RepID=UPI00100A4B15|nr:lasso peptide biosynthesis B2 protein [Luteimonas sp. YGD11-2]